MFYSSYPCPSVKSVVATESRVAFQPSWPQNKASCAFERAGVIYGPLTREAFNRLLVDGKIARTDLVSVRGGEWIEIAAFLLTPADAAAEDAILRLLAGQRMFSSLSRRAVEQLRSAGRVGDDDLICALNGPWMRLGDFFAPPDAVATAPQDGTPSIAPSAVPFQPVPAGAAPQAPPDAAPVVSGLVVSGPVVSGPAFAPARPAAPLFQSIPIRAPAQSPAPTTDALTPLHVMPGASRGYDSPPILPPGVWISDVWFVRIRGMHSAPLKKHHLRTLFEARELTADSHARNANWPENAWSPIRLIPELADVTK